MADINILTELYKLGTMYASQRKLAEARRTLAECIDKQSIALGESHPDTLHSIATLIRVYVICELR
jgi:hypothetical protein